MMYNILFRDQKGSLWQPPSGSIRSSMQLMEVSRSMARSFSQIEGVVYDETLDLVNPIHFHQYYHP
jgi:hypothetical protein